jgi:hypothetical protein
VQPAEKERSPSQRVTASMVFGQLGRRHDWLGMAARCDGLPDSKFDEPIPLPRGGPLVTLQIPKKMRLDPPERPD